jgi:hypothetical protein
MALEEITDDVLEPDFGPRIVFECAVTRAESVVAPSTHGYEY